MQIEKANLDKLHGQGALPRETMIEESSMSFRKTFYYIVIFSEGRGMIEMVS